MAMAMEDEEGGRRGEEPGRAGKGRLRPLSFGEREDEKGRTRREDERGGRRRKKKGNAFLFFRLLSFSF
jgi:hypothetical protein